MNKNELVAKRDALLDHRDNTDKEIGALDALIEAQKKPKLVLINGDVYVNSDGSPVTIGASYGDWNGTYSDGSQCTGQGDVGYDLLCSKLDGYKYSHNYLDDLKSLQEEVTEHHTGNGMQIRMTDEGLHFSTNFIRSENVDAAILAIRQMQATEKRQK